WFIDPRNRTDFWRTNRYCEGPVSTGATKTKRTNAPYSQAAISETAKSIIGVRKFDKLKLVRRKPRPVSSTAQVDEAQETSRRLTPHNLHSRTVLRSTSCGYWPSKPVHRFRVRQCLLRSDRLQAQGG